MVNQLIKETCPPLCDPESEVSVEPGVKRGERAEQRRRVQDRADNRGTDKVGCAGWGGSWSLSDTELNPFSPSESG